MIGILFSIVFIAMSLIILLINVLMETTVLNVEFGLASPKQKTAGQKSLNALILSRLR